MADNTGLHPQLLEAVMSINKDQRQVPVEKLEQALGGAGAIAGATVAVLGLAFKDNTDDMREAPAIDIVNALLQRGAAEVRVYDPVAEETARRLAPDWPVTYCADEYDCATGADGLILVTEWKRFRNLDPRRLRDAMRPSPEGPVFIDGRNLFDPTEMRLFGFRYQGIGRGSTPPNYAARELLAETPQAEPVALDGHTLAPVDGRARATGTR
jgi:UDPglucose 6-dehydrogenase